MLDFLRDIGKHFPVNRMLARDVVRTRLEEGISYTEFSYVLLQSLDYLELFRTYGCTLQFGGSDQWGNITAGVELIRRVEGARVHALATPLLTKADGTKFGKTESGTVWLDSSDDLAVRLPPVLPPGRGQQGDRVPQGVQRAAATEIDALAEQTRREPHRRLAQKALADDITALVHSAAARDAAVQAAAALFGQAELDQLPADVLEDVLTEVGARELEISDELQPSVVDVLTASGVVGSRSAARRAIGRAGPT